MSLSVSNNTSNAQMKKAVAFDIEWFESERKLDSTKALSPVQQRLCNWKPTPMSKHEIDSKLDDANRRRTEFITKSAEKNKIHQITVKKVCKELEEETQRQQSELKNEIDRKLDLAADNKNRLQAKTVEKLSNAMKEKMDRKADVLKKSSVASKDIRSSLATRLERASARKEKFIKDRVESIKEKENRYPVDGVKSCPSKVSLQNRLDDAEARRENVLEKRVELAKYHSNKKDLIHDEDEEFIHSRRLFQESM